MLQRINWRPDQSTVRYFAKTLAVLALLLALALFWLKGTAPAAWAAGCGLILAVVAYTVPWLGRWVYLLWMAVSYLLGLIVSPLVLALVFYLVLTPIGLIARAFGKDELKRRRRPSGDSYLTDVTDNFDPESFRRQF